VRPIKAENRQIRILIADNHPVFREGLQQLLEAENDFVVVGQADDGAQALHLTIELQPDILLLDASMPKMSGLEAVRRLAKMQSNTQVILVTAGIENSDLAAAIELGIRAVVLKQSATQTLYAAIRAVAAGHYWMVSEIVPQLVAGPLDDGLLSSSDRSALQVEFGLTPREMDIVMTVLKGKSNKDIAAQYSISEQTVKHHFTRIFTKLGISSRLQLILLINSRRAR
jgi:two-component system, NarL family, nitrate/nitrite response regulator NarL